ncbi:MAG: glycosyltransferase, partial [Candidatus Omnitrophota bacterium]|nr:glycosyltransferase [Candidatus Omnitrophota bacterium]
HTVGHEDDKDKILDHFHLKKDKVTILVMGGSQGSQRINQVFAATVQRLNNSLDMQIIHLCGRRDYAMLQSFYASLNIPYALFEFLNKMEWAYTAADVIIARAGAATVTELYLLEKPAILIPYPYAGGHQKYNAQVLVDLNRAKVIEEKDLNDVALEKAIVYFVQGKHSSKTAVPGTELSLYRDAAKRLAQEMLSLIS